MWSILSLLTMEMIKTRPTDQRSCDYDHTTVKGGDRCKRNLNKRDTEKCGARASFFVAGTNLMA